MITGSVERVETGTRVVQTAGATITELVDNAQHMKSLLSEISISAREQASGVAQVGVAVNELDRATQQNAALVEQTAAASAALKEQAIGLADEVARFQLP